jgi:hypothetical protein
MAILGVDADALRGRRREYGLGQLDGESLLSHFLLR